MRSLQKEERGCASASCRHDPKDTPSGSGDVGFTITCASGAKTNWSLALLENPGDENKHTTLAENLAGVIKQQGGTRAFAPRPSDFNGKIIPPNTLHRRIIRLPFGVSLFCNPDEPADGTFLHKAGDTGIISAGGCPLIVATFQDNLIFAHAGRNSLLDMTFIRSNGNQRSRPRESVVDDIMKAFGTTPETSHEVRAWVFFSIRPEYFSHPYGDARHGSANQALARFLDERGHSENAFWVEGRALHLDLPELIKEQFKRYGVPEGNVKIDHGLAYLPEGFAHTRVREKEQRNRRNLIAVTRTT